MGVKMLRWASWPVLSSRKFEVVIAIHRVEGLDLVKFDGEEVGGVKRRLAVEVKWKGPKIKTFGSLRQPVKTNSTEDGGFCGDGVFEWNEEFQNVCGFSSYYKDDLFFFPWEVEFVVYNGLKLGSKNKSLIVGTASINLAEFVCSTEGKAIDVNVPLTAPGCVVHSNPSLLLSLRFTAQDSSQAMQRSIPSVQSSPLPTEEKLSPVRARLRKVKSFADCMSPRRSNETHSNAMSAMNVEDIQYEYPFDTDSLDDDGLSDESMETSGVCSSVSYETMASANWAGQSFYSDMKAEDEGWVYYNDRRPEVGSRPVDQLTEKSQKRSPKHKLLSWKNRTLSFGARKAKAKGEPLLNKDCREEGGDDIDFDRRQFSSSDESSFGWPNSESSTPNRSSDSEFGDDCFAVGVWESKELTSRDGRMKLQTQVFHASIDQRSERAAGESACTALVVHIANWLQSNRDLIPIKSEFDNLIREGSLEWRNLCEKEDYRERFPDKHFDLETILEAKIRPLRVVPEKSFVGFFHPEGIEEGHFDFLHGAMSFDCIWDEICHRESDQSNNPLVYIVSWNDHFFVLKIEQDAYYIIDTLGERLYEGCNQAYVLKFDKDTTIETLLPEEKHVQSRKSKDTSEETAFSSAVICRGKESCKEYINKFLAAIPVCELLADMKKGLVASTLVHHRLQIEFHYTELLETLVEYPTEDTLGIAMSLLDSKNNN